MFLYLKINTNIRLIIWFDSCAFHDGFLGTLIKIAEKPNHIQSLWRALEIIKKNTLNTVHDLVKVVCPWWRKTLVFFNNSIFIKQSILKVRGIVIGCLMSFINVFTYLFIWVFGNSFDGGSFDNSMLNIFTIIYYFCTPMPSE